MICFLKFANCLKYNDIDAAKQLVTCLNVNDRAPHIDVIDCICSDGPDNPALLRYFMDLGYVFKHESLLFSSSPLYVAATHCKPNLLRALIDMRKPEQFVLDAALGFALLDDDRYHKNRLCACILVDAGARRDETKWRYLLSSDWVYDFATARKNARTASLIVLSIKRLHSGIIGINANDVLRIIARCIWSTRGHKRWIEPHERQQKSSKKIK